MAEFQWWLLLVGLVAGGGLVAVVSMDARRREEDLSALERRAEATWIADQLAVRDRAPAIDAAGVEAVLATHREYLGLPPPDRIVVEPLDVDPDGEAHDVRHDGRGGADQDLAPAAEQQAPSGQQAYSRADAEQGRH
jgi:hypothetical protein